MRLQSGHEYNVLHEGMTYEFEKDVYSRGCSIGGHIMILDFFNGDYEFAIELNVEVIMNLEVR